MKSKLWIIPALILCLVSCLAFTACGGDDADAYVPSAELDLKYVAESANAPEHYEVLGIIEGDENTLLRIPETAEYKYTVDEEVLDAEGNPTYDDNGEPITQAKEYTKEVPVTVIVSRAFYNNSIVERIEIGNNVTSIGDRAFDSCKAVTSVKIGSGITAIPEKAFINCSSLSSVTIPGTITSLGVSAFEGCSSLKSVEFEGESLKKVETRAFFGCSAIEEIKIPKSVNFIDVDAFTGCDKILERATKEEDGFTVYTDSVTYVDTWIVAWDKEYAGSYNVVVKDGTYGIAALAFASDALHSIDSITFPASVHTAVDNAFVDCMIVKAIAPAPVFKVIPLNTLEFAVIDGGKEISAGSFAGAPKLESVEIKGDVTVIGESAFAGCKKLSEVKIDAPTSITTIKNSAFKDCTAITSFDVTSGCTKIEDSAFQGCVELTSIKLGKVESIGSYAFAYCQALTSITLPEEATALGEHVFFNCNALASVTLPSKITKIPAHFFHGCAALESIAIPENVTSIGAYAFSECDSLTEVIIPGTAVAGENEITYTGVTSIGDAVFAGCDSLKTVVIPAGVNSIGNYAFYRCIALEGVQIPAICESIGTSAFEGCSAITTVTLPEGVKTVGNFAFYECIALGNITLSGALESVGKDAFKGCGAINFTVENGGYYLGNDTNKYMILVKIDGDFTAINTSTKIIGSSVFENCQLSTVVIPDSVTQIGEKAFSGALITSITLPANLVSLGNGAFENCALLTTIDIPASLKAISNYAFSGCASLTGITINGEIAIGRFAFANCESISELQLLNTITYLDDYAFSGCDSLWSIEISKIVGVGSYALSGSKITKATLPAEAFAGMDTSTLKEVVITSGKLGKKVFEGCTGLEKVTILEDVTDVDSTAFDGCTGVLEIIDNVVYVDSWVVGYNGKVDMSKINSSEHATVVIKEGTVGLSSNAFGMVSDSNGIYYAAAIRHITIPETVKYYSSTTFERANVKGATVPARILGYTVTDENGKNTTYKAAFDLGKIEVLTVTSGEIIESVFKNAYKLYSVTIGEGVTVIGQDAFKGCEKLVEVCNLSALEIVKGSSEHGYVAKNAVSVYGKDGQSALKTTDTGLVYIEKSGKIQVVAWASDANDLVLPAKIDNKDYDVYKYAFYYSPNIVTVKAEKGASFSIGDDAFEDSAFITTVDLNGVKEIGALAFSGCSGLTYVVLPKTLTFIGNGAFPSQSGAKNMRICYAGTADDFKNVNGGNTIKNMTYFYSEKKPTAEGKYWHYNNKNNVVVW